MYRRPASCYYTNVSKDYYTITVPLRGRSLLPATIRVEGERVRGELAASQVNPARWPDPPHVCLANLGVRAPTNPCPLEEVFLFTKRYGLLGSGEGGLDVWLEEDERKFDGKLVLFTAVFQDVQELLRNAWRGDEDAITTVSKEVRMEIYSQEGKAEVVTPDLWAFICALFIRDHAEGRLKVCRNPDCPAPYFVAVRRGKSFCSHRCAVLMNVRRFRERQKARRRRKKKVRAQPRKRRRTQR